MKFMTSWVGSWEHVVECFSDTVEWNFVKVGAWPTQYEPNAHRMIFWLDSKWLPGGEIFNFLMLTLRTCRWGFPRHQSMEFDQRCHVTSTVWVPWPLMTLKGQVQVQTNLSLYKSKIVYLRCLDLKSPVLIVLWTGFINIISTVIHLSLFWYRI